MNGFPSAADFQGARVTQPGQSEIIRQSLYDNQILPGAGSTQLNFFQQPIGQGITSALGATAATAKTQFDTNMSLGGQLPSGLSVLIESIEVTFYPGSVSTANTFTIDTLTFFLAAAAATPTAQLDDAWAFYQGGLLEFNVLQKNYLREAPLMRFPPKCVIDITGAIASNSATTSEVGFGAARSTGRSYYLEPPISLQSAVNFEVVLKWPGVVAMTSGFNARVGVILDGYTMRAAQ